MPIYMASFFTWIEYYITIFDNIVSDVIFDNINIP